MYTEQAVAPPSDALDVASAQDAVVDSVGSPKPEKATAMASSESTATRVDVASIAGSAETTGVTTGVEATVPSSVENWKGPAAPSLAMGKFSSTADSSGKASTRPVSIDQEVTGFTIHAEMIVR